MIYIRTLDIDSEGQRSFKGNIFDFLYFKLFLKAFRSVCIDQLQLPTVYFLNQQFDLKRRKKKRS